MPTEKARLEFCLFSGETALHLASRKARMEPENIILLVSDLTFDSDELPWHLRKLYDCERVLDDSKDDELAEKRFKKKIVKSGSSSSVSGAVLYKKHFFAISRR